MVHSGWGTERERQLLVCAASPGWRWASSSQKWFQFSPGPQSLSMIGSFRRLRKPGWVFRKDQQSRKRTLGLQGTVFCAAGGVPPCPLPQPHPIPLGSPLCLVSTAPWGGGALSTVHKGLPQSDPGGKPHQWQPSPMGTPPSVAVPGLGVRIVSSAWAWKVCELSLPQTPLPAWALELLSPGMGFSTIIFYSPFF